MKRGYLHITGIALSDWKDAYKGPRVVKGEVQFPLVRANRVPKSFEWGKRYRQARYSKVALRSFLLDHDDPHRWHNAIEYLAIYDKQLSDDDVVALLREWDVAPEQVDEEEE